MLFLACTLTSAAQEAESYSINKRKSTVTWIGKKATGQHEGTVAVRSGDIEMTDGKLSGGSITLNMKDITCTDIEDKEQATDLVKHLKAPDFFHSSEFPQATYVIESVRDGKKEGVVIASGKLTIKGMTQAIDVAIKAGIKGDQVVAVGKLFFDRTKFGVNYGSSIGNAMIADIVELNFVVVGAK